MRYTPGDDTPDTVSVPCPVRCGSPLRTSVRRAPGAVGTCAVNVTGSGDSARRLPIAKRSPLRSAMNSRTDGHACARIVEYVRPAAMASSTARASAAASPDNARSSTTVCTSVRNIVSYDGRSKPALRRGSSCSRHGMFACASTAARPTVDRTRDAVSHRCRLRDGRENSAAMASAGRIVACAAVRSRPHVDSSRHSESALIHSRPSPATPGPPRQLNSSRGESGCARMAMPPCRWMSAITSSARPASGYGDAASSPSATTCPSRVLISTASIVSTPWRYAGGSGERVASPWSVRMMNCRPAWLAASAMASGVPVPSDRVLWM